MNICSELDTVAFSSMHYHYNMDRSNDNNSWNFR
jgi:hypothetical protein